MKLPFGNPQDGHVDIGLLSAYLDEQATPVEQRRVEGHLRTCVACQGELEHLRRTVALLHALPRVAVPRAFTLSEAQVGIRRPAGQPAWLGGMLRGLAAVSAVAVVAVVAATLLGRPTWEPTQQVARVAAPAAAPLAETDYARVQAEDTVKAPEAAPASTPSAVAAAPVPAPRALPAGESAKAPAPTAVPAVEKTAAPTRMAPVQKAATAAPTVAPPSKPQPTPEKPALALAAAPPAPTPTAMQALARSTQETGGAAAAAAAGKSGPAVTEAAPAVMLTDLPAEAALVYADASGLWALDRSGGMRQFAKADGLTAPIISSDRSWVAYRLQKADGVEVWDIPWTGGEPKLLLAEKALNAELPSGYRQRRIQDVRWIPGKRALAVTTLVTPAAADAAAVLELWRVDAISGVGRLVADADPQHRPVVAPNDSLIAFFRRTPDSLAEGGLWIAGADGTGERAVLRFPAPPDQRSYDGQLSWLPDSSALWAAIPDAGPNGSQPANGLTLYQVPAKGDAQPVAHVDAHEAFWSPDGTRLAYTRLTSDATGSREIYLAGADGANPQLYAATLNGRFSGWAPDSSRFLYEDGGQLLVGAPGQKPLRLAANTLEPRWWGANQVLYLVDQGDARQLTSQAVEGKATPLQPLPPGATFDAVRP